MSYRVIAFDLDGTLLDDRKNIPEENLRALEAAAGAGMLPVAATGRIMAGIPEAVRSLPFLRYYISINGAHVYDALEDRVLYRSEIPLELTLRFIEYMDTLPIIYDCYQANQGWMSGWMMDRAEEYFSREPFMLEMLYKLRVRVDNLADALRQRGEAVQKLQMHFKPEQAGERLRQLELIPRLFPELRATSSLKNNIEINSADSGKGRALTALCRSLGIDPSASVAFGDGSNDIDMLRAAGLGVAMANAEEQVKAAADIVTGSNNEAGVAQMIWRLLKEGER